jgi:hypothetical protein
MRGIHLLKVIFPHPWFAEEYLETVQRFRARECGCERARSDGSPAVMFRATAAQAVISLRSPLQLGTEMKYDYEHEHRLRQAAFATNFGEPTGSAWQTTTRSGIINH